MDGKFIQWKSMIQFERYIYSAYEFIITLSVLWFCRNNGMLGMNICEDIYTIAIFDEKILNLSLRNPQWTALKFLRGWNWCDLLLELKLIIMVKWPPIGFQGNWWLVMLRFPETLPFGRNSWPCITDMFYPFIIFFS